MFFKMGLTTLILLSPFYIPIMMWASNIGWVEVGKAATWSVYTLGCLLTVDILTKNGDE